MVSQEEVKPLHIVWMQGGKEKAADTWFHSLIEGEEVKKFEELNDNALGYIVRKWGAAVKNVLKCEIGFEIG